VNKFTVCCLLAAFLAVLMDAGENTASNQNIVYFDEPFALNVFGAYGITSFSQEQEAEYQAQNPWALGFGLRYKQVSFSFSLPSFYVFDDTQFKSFNIQINSYYDAIYYETFLKNYQGFSLTNSDDTYIDLNLFLMGISAGWILNNKNHSLSAVYDLDSRQLTSSGSFLFGIGGFYTSIYSGNDSIRHYADKQRFIYFGPNAGYSYTFVFPHNMFLNINHFLGLDAGINTNENRWLFVPQIMPKISFGYHSNSWSINFIGSCNDIIIFWDRTNFDNILYATMTITFSKRLAFKKLLLF
jgi:hypothetical protein